MCVPLEDPIQPEDLATVAARVALEKKGDDVQILDMRKLIDYADYFVLATARNRRQVEAIAESVRQAAKVELKVRADGLEGLQAAKWVLVDFGDVIVHVFDEAMRGFYDLDGLWQDAPRLELPHVDVPAGSADGDDDDDDDASETSAASFFSFRQ